MKTVWRDIAKVAVGYAAAETIGHWWVGIWGQHLLPMDIGWFTFTKEMNQVVMIIWPLALLALIALAWGRRTADRTSPSYPHCSPA